MSGSSNKLWEALEQNERFDERVYQTISYDNSQIVNLQCSPFLLFIITEVLYCIIICRGMSYKAQAPQSWSVDD